MHLKSQKFLNLPSEIITRGHQHSGEPSESDGEPSQSMKKKVRTLQILSLQI